MIGNLMRLIACNKSNNLYCGLFSVVKRQLMSKQTVRVFFFLNSKFTRIHTRLINAKHGRGSTVIVDNG